jgi:hypothetical protein
VAHVSAPRQISRSKLGNFKKQEKNGGVCFFNPCCKGLELDRRHHNGNGASESAVKLAKPILDLNNTSIHFPRSLQRYLRSKTTNQAKQRKLWREYMCPPVLAFGVGSVQINAKRLTFREVADSRKHFEIKWRAEKNQQHPSPTSRTFFLLFSRIPPMIAFQTVSPALLSREKFTF